MLCYKDMTFCKSSVDRCFNTKCYRFLTSDDWARANDMKLGIAFSDFWDGCVIKKEKFDGTI